MRALERIEPVADRLRAGSRPLRAQRQARREADPADGAEARVRAGEPGIVNARRQIDAAVIAMPGVVDEIGAVDAVAAVAAAQAAIAPVALPGRGVRPVEALVPAVAEQLGPEPIGVRRDARQIAAARPVGRVVRPLLDAERVVA